MAKLCEMLVFLRKQKGISQQALANELGISRSSIGMYETGKREPEIEILRKMAALYGVSLNTITGVGFQDIWGNYENADATPEKLLRFDRTLRGSTPVEDWANVYPSDEGGIFAQIAGKETANEDESSLLHAIRRSPSIRTMIEISKNRCEADIMQATAIIEAFYRSKDVTG